MSWDPIRDLLTMQERLESLFGHASPGWVPPVDLVELADRFVLTIELPGLARADVSLDYADQALVVRGHRSGQVCCPEKYQQLERGQGQFSRTFRFAVPVVPESITADIADGILTITIPRAMRAGRRIEVS